MPSTDPAKNKLYCHRWYVRNRRKRLEEALLAGDARVRRCVICDQLFPSEQAMLSHETQTHTVACEPFVYRRGHYFFNCARPHIEIWYDDPVAFTTEPKGTLPTRAVTVNGMLVRCNNWLLANAGEQLRFKGIVIEEEQ